MLNSRAFRRKKFSSHVAGVLTYLMWEVPSAGQYFVSVFEDGKLYRELEISARDSNSNIQLNLDLASSNSKRGVLFEVKPKGQVFFYCSKGIREFQVKVKQKADRDKTVFDSERLTSADRFILNPMRAGQYTFALVSQNTSGTITVAAPREKHPPAKELTVETVTVADTGLKPAQVKVLTGQPILFEIQTASKFEITFAK